MFQRQAGDVVADQGRWSGAIFFANGITWDINVHLHPINYGILRCVGVNVLRPFIAWGPARAGEDRRPAYITEYVERVLTISTIEPIANVRTAIMIRGR